MEEATLRFVILISTALALCFGAQLCPAQTAPPADIKTLKAKYEQGLAAIQGETNKALTNSVQGYADALKALGQKLQGAGDLDGMLAVKKESERFEKEKTIPESAVVADCVALRDLQTKWQKMPDTIDVNKSKKIVTLSKGHIAALEEVKKQLTMQGKVEEAVVVKDEIERARTSADVTAAEFVLTCAGMDLAAKTNAVAKAVAPTRTDPLARLRSSLVLYYPFDKDEGGKITDKSGKRNDGAAHGAKWVDQGKRGGAFEFDGHGYIAIGPGKLDTLANVTFCFWVNCAQPVAHDWCIFSHYANDGSRMHIGAGAAGVSACIVLGGAQEGCGSPKMDFSRWTHVVVSMGHNGMALYLNGQLANNSAGKLTLASLGHSTANDIGVNSFATMHARDPLEGAVDEVMIFNRALSAEEVKQIYDAQK